MLLHIVSKLLQLLGSGPQGLGGMDTHGGDDLVIQILDELLASFSKRSVVSLTVRLKRADASSGLGFGSGIGKSLRAYWRHSDDATRQAAAQAGWKHISGLRDGWVDFAIDRGEVLSKSGRPGARQGRFGTIKIGVSNSGSRRHFQPRLPGSVVGDASMDREARGNKITEDNDL